MSQRMDKPRRIWLCRGLAQDQGNACCPPPRHCQLPWELRENLILGCCGSIPPRDTMLESTWCRAGTDRRLFRRMQLWHEEGEDMRTCRVTSQPQGPARAQVALRQQPLWLRCWGRRAEKSQSAGNRRGKKFAEEIPAGEGKSSGIALSLPTKC